MRLLFDYLKNYFLSLYYVRLLPYPYLYKKLLNHLPTITIFNTKIKSTNLLHKPKEIEYFFTKLENYTINYIGNYYFCYSPTPHKDIHASFSTPIFHFHFPTKSIFLIGDKKKFEKIHKIKNLKCTEINKQQFIIILLYLFLSSHAKFIL